MYNKNFNGVNGLANHNFDEIITKIGGISADSIKYYLKKYGLMKLDDEITLHQVYDNDRVLRITFPDGNWRNVVKNHSAGSRCNWEYVRKQVRQIMCTHYDVPTPDNFPTFNDWAEDLYEYGFCSSEKRWAKIRADYEASYPGYDEMVARYSK